MNLKKTFSNVGHKEIPPEPVEDEAVKKVTAAVERVAVSSSTGGKRSTPV